MIASQSQRPADGRDERPRPPAPAARRTAPVLLRENDGPIAVLTLNRPATRNSLSEAMLAALGDAFTAIAADRERARGRAGGERARHSRAGHDLKELTGAAQRRRRRPRLFQAHHGDLQRHDAADRRACRSR